MKNMLKDALILLIITLGAGLMLGFVYQITKEPIAVQKEKAKMEAYSEVFPTAANFEKDADNTFANAPAILEEAGFPNQAVEEEVVAKDEKGNAVGYVLTIRTKEAYAGDITFTMGIQMDGTLNGISILSIAETPGLGMQAEEVLKPQFTDKKVDSFEYTKSGSMADNQIDAISGATITTNAVTNGVNAGLAYFKVKIEGGNSNE